MENTTYELIQINDTTWRIEDGVVRSFLFVGTEKALLIDSGFGTGDLKAIIESLTSLPVMLLNTHADHDHIGGNSQFKKAFMHRDDLYRYRQIVGEVPVVELIQEGDVINLGNRCFEIILIPGHTPGSIALLDAENRILIAGDTVQAGTIYLAGEGRDIKTYTSSLKILRDMSERFDIVYPSHGPFPVNAGIIHELICGLEKVEAGLVPAEEAHPPFTEIAKSYDIIAAKIIF